MLNRADTVARALVVYTDWWQPASTSVIQVGPSWSGGRWRGEGLRPGLLETLDERSELQRRMAFLKEIDRQLLFLWYVQQLSVEEISQLLRISRRQCFRRRAQALKRLVELGEDDAA